MATPKETAQVLAYLHGNWPSMPIDDAVTRVWSGALSSIPFDECMDTCSYLVSHAHYWPNVSEFFDAHSHVRKLKYAERAASHGLTEPYREPAPEDVTRAGFAECKRILDQCLPNRPRRNVGETADRKIPTRSSVRERAEAREKVAASVAYHDPNEPF